MTGSGNDFVFFDGRQADSELLTSPEVIQAICNRHNGIGADGIVILEPVEGRAAGDEIHRRSARIHYFNSDGTPADLCGNATLCSTVMSVELGMTLGDGMALQTPSGEILSRLVDGEPELRLQPVTRVEATMDSRVIRIADNGSFSGKVSIDIAEIHGRFEGELTARSQLIIHATGKVIGKIRYGKLVIDEGGELCGDINALSGEKSTPFHLRDEPAKALSAVAG